MFPLHRKAWKIKLQFLQASKAKKVLWMMQKILCLPSFRAHFIHQRQKIPIQRLQIPCQSLITRSCFKSDRCRRRRHHIPLTAQLTSTPMVMTRWWRRSGSRTIPKQVRRLCRGWARRGYSAIVVLVMRHCRLVCRRATESGIDGRFIFLRHLMEFVVGYKWFAQ